MGLRAPLVMAFPLLVLMAGCADEAADEPTPTSVASHPITTSMSTTSTTSSSTSTTSQAPAPRDFHVGSNYFDPSSATMANGTLTRWILDFGSHTVTIRNAASQEVFTREPLAASGAEYRFDRTGDYTVVCKYHGSMTVSIQVQ